MRQVGSLPDQREAERFAAYLVTQGIELRTRNRTTTTGRSGSATKTCWTRHATA